ncbi:MAG: hypothetical protein IJ607_01130 [Bacteroidaceae bacterium]|nr:hypothetical protein [Bacteroidaceae bacterium]
MKLIESINYIYDKQAQSFEEMKGAFVVTEENDPQTTFKKLTVHKKGCQFFVVKPPFYTGISATTSDRSSVLKDSSCDGIAISETDGYYTFYFIELKSRFREATIRKAFTQIFFSFIKMHMMLGLSHGYKPEKSIFDFFVACSPPENQDRTTEIMHWIQLYEEKNMDDVIIKCIKEFFFGKKKYSCIVRDMNFADMKHFNENFQNIQVRLNIYTPGTFKQTEGLLEL